MSDELMTIYAIMPKEIYKTKEITPEAKLIAERLVYLCKKEGYSWVTNKTLAEIYGTHPSTISQHISSLRKYGFIKCVYGKTNNKSNRVIYLKDDLWTKWQSITIPNGKEGINQAIKHNNNYKYKDNNKVIEPSWLNQDIKAQEWDMNNPEDVKAKQELEDILAEFRGDNHE